MKEYKPGIYKHQISETEWLLEQNPETDSIFAIASRQGIKVEWVMRGEPTPSHKVYQGDVVVNGERIKKDDAKFKVEVLILQKLTKGGLSG